MASNDPQENSDCPDQNRVPNDRPDSTENEVAPRATKSEPPEAKPECRKACQAKKHWLDYATFVVECMGLIGLGIVVLLTYGVWGANKKSADTAAKQMKVDSRPWIVWGPFVGYIRYPNPDDFFFKPSFVNVGKTPAMNFNITINYKIFPKTHVFAEKDIEFRPERRDSKEVNSYHAATFNPGFTWGPPDNFTFEERLPIPEWEELLHGDKIFYLFVKTTYQDVFGRQLYSHFCGYYRIGLGPPLIPCDVYNDITPEAD